MNSMTGIPKTGTYTEIGHGSMEGAGRGSLSSFVMHNKGPDRIKKTRQLVFQPGAAGEIAQSVLSAQANNCHRPLQLLL
jgi:hypothetical protein